MRIPKIKTDTKKIAIVDLVADRDCQPREELNRDVVGRYQELLVDDWGKTESWPFPPISVALVDRRYIVVDGWHRIAAAKDSGASEVPCEIVATDKTSAIMYAAGANGEHGYPLNRADRRRAIGMVLSVDPSQSDRVIARLVGASPSTVGHVRTEMRDSGLLDDDCERIGADGKKYTICERPEPQEKIPKWLESWEATIHMPQSGVQFGHLASPSESDATEPEQSPNIDPEYARIAPLSETERDQEIAQIQARCPSLLDELDAAQIELRTAREGMASERRDPAKRASGIFRHASDSDRYKILRAIFRETNNIERGYLMDLIEKRKEE